MIACFLTVAIWHHIQPLPNYAPLWFLNQSLWLKLWTAPCPSKDASALPAFRLRSCSASSANPPSRKIPMAQSLMPHCYFGNLRRQHASDQLAISGGTQTNACPLTRRRRTSENQRPRGRDCSVRSKNCVGGRIRARGGGAAKRWTFVWP